MKIWHVFSISFLVASVLVPAPVTAHEGHGHPHGTKPIGPTNPRPPKSQAELPTTSADIFLNNLNGQIVALQRHVKLDLATAGDRNRLAKLTFSVAQFRGDLAGQQSSIDRLTSSIDRDGTNAESYLARATMQQSLHRFQEAQEDVKRAIEQGAPPYEVEAVQQELDWNTGNYQAAIRAIRQAAEQDPSTKTLARLARLEHDLGNYAASDRCFEQAEDAFFDTNPLLLSWLNIQRGVCQLMRANLRASVQYFQEAVSRMPCSLVARSHLADALDAIGEQQEAVNLYEAILEQSTNPEFCGALATIYRDLGDLNRADRLNRKATQGFKLLVRDFPEAMAGHASHFFLHEGSDPKLALQLTRRNLALRPTSEAYQALARAQLANDRVADAAESIAIAMKMPVKSLNLAELQAEVQKLHHRALK